jgi:predicted nucleic acid-binding protein
VRSFFDTNVLVYLFDEDSPEKQAAVRELVRQETADGRAVLSTQVLQEFYVAITRKLALPVPPPTALQALDDLCALPVVQVDKDLVLRGARRSQAGGFSFWDALIVESALQARATTLWTEDLQHGQTVETLRIANPFR